MASGKPGAVHNPTSSWYHRHDSSRLLEPGAIEKRKLRVGIISAPFGLGPSAKAVAIGHSFAPSIETQFFSSIVCAQFAARSNVFQGINVIDFERPVTAAAGISSLDAVVSVNTTRFHDIVLRYGKPHFFLDTLAWARSVPPTLLSEVGFLYLAVVLDAFSRRIIGWAMGTTQKAQLVIDAVNMAITQRKPSNVIHHSDQGSQYTSVAFGVRCKEMGVRPSMGSVGDCYDCDYVAAA